MKKFFSQNFALKLFLFQAVILILSFAILAALLTVKENARTLDNFLMEADRYSDIVKKSTRSGMLKKQRDNVSAIIEDISKHPGVEGIKIYNKKGESIYASALSTGDTDEGRVADMQAEACQVCHGEKSPLEKLPMEKRYRFLDTPRKHRVIGLINPILNEKDCAGAGCHPSPDKQKILGIVDVKMSLEAADSQIRGRIRGIFFYAGMLALVISFISGVLIYFFVRVPVKKLEKGTEAIAAGNFDYRVDISGRGEIGQLAHSFNNMIAELKEYRTSTREMSDSLKEKIDAKTRELEAMQASLMQAEKMISLGRLSSTVAHELNNPLAGILTYTKLLMRDIKDMETRPLESQPAMKTLDTIYSEALRCGSIVKNMLLFSKQTEVNFKVENLHSLLDTCVDLVNHHFELNNIKLVKNYGAVDDKFECDINQLKQAFIAIFINAVESMAGKGGTVEITTSEARKGPSLKVSVRDEGSGIAKDALPLIFEPFFTTKSDECRVGLGLSVVYGVVKRHGGSISVESEAGRGTVFHLELRRKIDEKRI